MALPSAGMWMAICLFPVALLTTTCIGIRSLNNGDGQNGRNGNRNRRSKNKWCCQRALQWLDDFELTDWHIARLMDSMFIYTTVQSMDNAM